MSSREPKRASAAATLKLLCGHWPLCFRLADRKPLKVGITYDLMRELGDVVPHAKLKAALNLYCGDLDYLSGLKAGASRIDLYGDEADTVSSEDELHAAERLKTLKLRGKP
jgi:ProP effector